jgi:hypothetical protein
MDHLPRVGSSALSKGGETTKKSHRRLTAAPVEKPGKTSILPQPSLRSRDFYSVIFITNAAKRTELSTGTFSNTG